MQTRERTPLRHDSDPHTDAAAHPSTILFLAANPVNGEHLRLDEECREIEKKLHAGRFAARLRFRARWAARPDDLLVGFLEDEPSALHFSGHGAADEGLWFQGEDGKALVVTTDVLNRVMCASSGRIKIVVLNACYSDVQARSLINHVPCVIGMSRAIKDGAAIAYSAAFYRALAFAHSVESAHQHGLAAFACATNPRNDLARDVDVEEVEHALHKPSPVLLAQSEAAKQTCLIDTFKRAPGDPIDGSTGAQVHLELTIDKEFDQLDTRALAEIISELRRFAGGKTLRIICLAKGSVRLTISLPLEAAATLMELRTRGGLTQLGGSSVSRVVEVARIEEVIVTSATDTKTATLDLPLSSFKESARPSPARQSTGPARLAAAAGSHDDTRSTIVSSMVKPDGNGALPPTLPTVPLPGDPTRTAHSTAASTAQPTITPTQLRGPERYQIIGEHGRGGLGKVSRAHDRELGRDVAIKELISRTAVSEVRFLREAMITARLEHPGIVPVHEAGRRADGTPYYAMKLVSGRPLRDLIVERTTVDQRIGLLHHVIAVADAIAYAHGRNIIHRDLKPSNVIVGDFGETIVIDWGLAKDLSASDEARFAAGSARSPQDSDLTAAGAVLGTPTYMAPEQERGEHVDQRADVFAIGAMLWELCSLQKVPPPNLRQRLRLLRRAGIDQDLAVIIDKALDNDPARRYPDAGAVAADLKAFKSGARISARSYSLFAMLAHWTRRHFALAISVLVALVIAILVGSIQYRTVLKVRVAEQIAEARATEAEVEQGRQALLHDESTEALTHLAAAYQRGDRTASVEFMLARALQPRLAERARFTSTAGRIWSATFSPDGRRIVTTDDATAQVWDAQTSRILFTLGHGDIVYHVVCSTDGRMATAGADGIVRIWSLANGTLLRALQWHDGKRFSYFKVAMSTDSHFVAAIDNLGKVAHVWETDTGAPIAELRNDGFENPSLAFSTDGRWLVTSGGDDVRVFDTATWKMVRTLPASRVLSLSFDPTGPRIVTGTASGDASIWAIPTGNRLRHLREIGEPIDRVAFSPNGEFVATASRDSAEQVWRTGSGTLQSQGKYHRGRIFSLEFDSSSTLVLSAGESGTVVVSDAALALPVAVLDGPRAVVREAHFDPSSRRVVAASWDGTARVWDATSPYRRWNSPPVGDDCDTVESLVPDGRYIALSCRDHGTRVWDTARDQLLAELPSVTAIDGDYYSAFPAVSATGDRAAIARGNTVAIYELPGARLLRTITHSAAVNAVAFARTGHDLVSGAIDGSLLVVHDDHDTIALAASAGGIDAVEFLPNGRVVVTDALRRLRVYDPDRNVVLADVEVPARVRSMRSSDDARRLLTIPVRKKPAPPVLWDLESYRIVARLDGHHGRVFSARFVAQGTQILSAANDGTVRLWDGMTGTLRQTYRGTSRFLFDAAMNADGTVIVGGDNEGYLRFWEAASGRPLWALKAHKSYVVGIHFESNEIVTRGFDGSISRWMLPPSKSVIEACLSSETASLDQPCTIMLR